MGNQQTKAPQEPTDATNIDPEIDLESKESTTESNELINDLERCRMVHHDIGRLLKEHKEKIHQKYPKFWPAISILFDHLSEFSEDLEDDRAVNIAVVGYPFEGKTHVINALANGGQAPTDREGAVGTKEMSWYTMSAANLCVLDTVGDAMQVQILFLLSLTAIQDKTMRNQLKGQLKEKKADIIMVVISPSTVVLRDSMRSLSATVKEMRSFIQKEFNFEAPVLVAFNKLDLFHNWKRSNFQGTWADYSEFLEQNYYSIVEVHTMLEDRFPLYQELSRKDKVLVLTSCESYTTGDHFGIRQLNENIDMKLYRKIINNRLLTYESFRLSTANKIIAAFSSAAGAVGAVPIPGLDVVATYYITDMMIQMLSCLAVDPTRSAEKYKKSSRLVLGILTALRTIGVVAAIPLELTGIALPIGMALGAASAGGVTGALGWHAYRFFTDPHTAELVFDPTEDAQPIVMDGASSGDANMMERPMRKQLKATYGLILSPVFIEWVIAFG
ncbi:hypothetical protein PROFUN_13987 [Planoprotostelium fungivorum]|uniref:G domain-containing protein n=1 Tax=Planoprotostelium fungivorum TaxID=1890364 RepID=A0A2P6N2L4_9EUKA|nr:hypothetical protein PROFUN_13987 [Planoprotostelium fungivorum]